MHIQTVLCESIQSLFHDRSSSCTYKLSLRLKPTRDIQLAPREPVDLPARQIAVLHTVEKFGPCQPFLGDGSPESVGVFDWQLVYFCVRLSSEMRAEVRLKGAFRQRSCVALRDEYNTLTRTLLVPYHASPWQIMQQTSAHSSSHFSLWSEVWSSVSDRREGGGKLLTKKTDFRYKPPPKFCDRVMNQMFWLCCNATMLQYPYEWEIWVLHNNVLPLIVYFNIRKMMRKCLDYVMFF